MDPILIILIVGAAVLFGGGIFNNWYDKRKQVPQKSTQNTDLVTISWDDDWLREENNRHLVIKITPEKLYLFGDITKPVTEGFQWACKCSGKGIGIDLNMCQRTFNKHVKEEREKALAEIGRFK